MESARAFVSTILHDPVARTLTAAGLLSLAVALIGALPRLQDFIKRRYVWIFILAAIALAGPLWWIYLGELRAFIGKMFVLVDADHTPEELRNLAYSLGAMLTAIAVLAAAPFQLIKTWLNERQTITAETVMFTTRFTQAVEQLGAEKAVKRTETYRVRTIEYDMPAGDQSHPVEFRHREGEPFTIPSDVENDAIRYGEWETATATTEETVPNLEVRLGAIYALERIAQDSERDHIPVMETLCAYIRENADAHQPTEDEPKSPPRANVGAALDVIARRSEARKAYETRNAFVLDLRRSRFHYRDLRQRDFTRADLRDARFGHANLFRTVLADTKLSNTSFAQANLHRADLGNAYVFGTKFEGAQLSMASIDGAVFVAVDNEGVEELRKRGAVGKPRAGRADRAG